MTAQHAGGWHAGDAALQEFCDGTVGPVMGASVETHLMQCALCRSRLTAITPREPLDEVWLAIRERIEPDAPSVIERSYPAARPVRSSPPVCWPPSRHCAVRGCSGMSAALLFSAVAAALRRGPGPDACSCSSRRWLPVARCCCRLRRRRRPLARDRHHHALLRRPACCCLRTAGVLVSTVPAAVLAGLVLPGPTWLALAWLGPAAAGIAIALLAAPYVGMTVASGTIAVGWSFAVVAATRLREPLDPGRAGDAGRLSTPSPRSGSRSCLAPTPHHRPAREAVMSATTLNDVTKRYGRTAALDHVNLHLAPGITGLLGPERGRQDDACCASSRRGWRRRRRRAASSAENPASSPGRLGHPPAARATCRRSRASPAGSRPSGSSTTWPSSRSGRTRRPGTARCAGCSTSSASATVASEADPRPVRRAAAPGRCWPRHCSATRSCWSSTSRPPGWTPSSGLRLRDILGRAGRGRDRADLHPPDRGRRRAVRAGRSCSTTAARHFDGTVREPRQRRERPRLDGGRARPRRAATRGAPAPGAWRNVGDPPAGRRDSSSPTRRGRLPAAASVIARGPHETEAAA